MENDTHSIVDTQMVEYTGLFYILNSKARKIYNINILKMIAKIELFILCISAFMFCFSMYYSTNDINSFFNYLMMVVSFCGMSLNQFYLIRNSDAIWDFLRATKVGFLSFNTPARETIGVERFKYKTVTTITLIWWFFVNMTWIISPAFQHDSWFIVNYKNSTYQYHFTPMNFIIPVTDGFYNSHYYAIYAFDETVALTTFHVTILFDFLIITSCMSMQCQFRRIGDWYSNFIFFQYKCETGKGYFF